MLETVRAYARERLADSDEEGELRRRHARVTLDLGIAVFQALREGVDRAVVNARIDPEHDNVRAALEWARDSGEDEILLDLVSQLTWFWGSRGYWQEADVWLEIALERSSTAPTESRMRLLRAAYIRVGTRGDYARSDVLIAEWLQLAQQAGDEEQVLLAMNAAAYNAADQGLLDRARSEFAAMKRRAEDVGNDNMVAFAIVNLGMVAWRARDFESSLEHSTTAVELFRERRDDAGVATALTSCGWAAVALADATRAEGFFREALPMVGSGGWILGIAENAYGLGVTMIALHQAERGAQLVGAAGALLEEHGISLDDDLQEEMRERAAAEAEAALGADAFAAARARGEGMTIDEIVAFGTA
jgi:hypothetical protein